MLNRYQASLTLTRTAVYALLAILTLLCVVPFYLMIINSTRTNNEILAGLTFVPGSSLKANWDTLTIGLLDPVSGERSPPMNVFGAFVNSFLVAISATALTGYFGALTAYGFALYDFRFKKFLWSLILAVLMIPSSVSLIGFFKLVAALGMIDTYWPLILPSIASPFAVFFLRQYLATALPRSLIEAARIDGAGEWATFHRIGLTIAGPGIATIAILTFLGNWNSYLAPLIVLSKEQLFTMPLLIGSLNRNMYSRDWGTMYLAISLSVIPLLAMFALFSRYLIEGITAGGVKE
jgi:multiple sugar transport system permease protein